jgi:hypothetical protein
MATRKQQADDGVGYQEGSRWVNKRPSGDEVAAWFKANAPMHEGMDPCRTSRSRLASRTSGT